MCRNILKITALAMLLGACSVASAITAPYTVVLKGIDSPRQMEVDSKGNLYIASSGIGGSGTPFALTRSFSLVGPICQGNTGKILRLSPNGKVKTIVDNLPSQANCQNYNPGFEQSYKGTVAAGPSGLAVFENQGNTSLFVSFGGSTEETTDFCLPGGVTVNGPDTGPNTVTCDPNFKPTNPANLIQSLQELLGDNGVKIFNSVGVVQVNNYSGNGPSYKVLFNQMKFLENQYNFDQVNTAGLYQFPGWTNLENDIVSVLKVGNTVYAVDAGANVIWALSLTDGTAKASVVMPNIGCSVSPCAPPLYPLGSSTSGLQQSVPTAIARNPITGKIYIAEVGGFDSSNPHPAGTSRLFLFDPSTNPATLTQVSFSASGDLQGLSAINNIAFDQKGNLYAVQYNNSNFNALPLINGPGALVQIKLSDPTHATIKVIDDTIPGPSGVAVGNGKIYVGDNEDAGINQAEIRAYNLP